MAMLLAISRLGRSTSQGMVIRRSPTCLSLALIRSLHNNKEPIKVTWEKPQEGWTKLNFDGSLRGKTGGARASIGGVFRNHEAEFLLGYAESIKPSTSIVAELAALRRGLELTLENGWGDVWLEGDAKVLLDIVVKRKPVRSLEAQRHVSCINDLIPELKRFRLTHVYREGNRAADRLAQMGHRLDTPKIWKWVPPEEVVEIVHQDAQGRVFLRRR